MWPFFGNRVFASVTKSRWGHEPSPWSSMTGVCTKGKDGHTGKTAVEEAGGRDWNCQQDCGLPSEAKRQRVWPRESETLLESRVSEEPCQHPAFRLPASRTGRGYISVPLSHPICRYIIIAALGNDYSLWVQMCSLNHIQALARGARRSRHTGQLGEIICLRLSVLQCRNNNN